MARVKLSGMTIGGLLLVFLGIVLVSVVLFNGKSVISAFTDMECQEGLKPCEEGSFCLQSKCVPVSLKYNYDNVNGYVPKIDLSA
jgi:hypothetical protein